MSGIRFLMPSLQQTYLRDAEEALGRSYPSVRGPKPRYAVCLPAILELPTPVIF